MATPKNIKINKHLLKDMERIEKKDSYSTLTGEKKLNFVPTNGSNQGVTIKVKTPALARLGFIITNPIAYLFIGKIRG